MVMNLASRIRTLPYENAKDEIEDLAAYIDVVVWTNTARPLGISRSDIWTQVADDLKRGKQ